MGRAFHPLAISLQNISLSKNLTRCHHQLLKLQTFVYIYFTFCDRKKCSNIFGHLLPQVSLQEKLNLILSARPFVRFNSSKDGKLRHCISHFPPFQLGSEPGSYVLLSFLKKGNQNAKLMSQIISWWSVNSWNCFYQITQF